MSEYPTALKILKELNRCERTCTIFNAFGNPQKKAEVKKALAELKQAINSYEKLSAHEKERESIFVLLNEKQLPVVGGMCLDSIIRNLVKQFERRQAFIEEHAETEAYREYEVYCNEQDIEQALKQSEKP